ncbi:MAG: TrpB-like pyridoxal phosphate-dependent enzyme [Archaeoglobales archaeon]|nr:MAG: TrpB-like pyridoxal phosphate-dependent enzyme [Archaeoglobales archaeon]
MHAKIFLSEDEMPDKWYNILPDLPRELPPPIDPATREPIKPEALERIFAKELIKQEVSQDRWIKIPEEVREIYSLWRPTPLFRARRLEKMLRTPARIYYKFESISPAGSHKPNTAVAQAYYNLKEGIERLTTETGAGQWGSALAFAGAMLGIDVTVYMVKCSYEQKPFRRVLMQLWNADVVASPSNRTKFGSEVLSKDPDNPGSLGIAISEAIEDAVTHENTKYTLGSVLNHVLIHQTIIGLETKKQFEAVDDYPDLIVGCIGGGSSFSGLFWPFYYDKVSGKAPKDVEFLATESTAAPSVSKGVYMYDHGDTARLTPLLKMHTLGHEFVPPPIHAGGLRYHGMAPTLCLLANEGIVKVKAYNQLEVFDAAAMFANSEGHLPAPEPTHAIKAVIDEAIRCKETKEEKTILFLLCGHGHFDMKAYQDYIEGKLLPYEYPEEEVKKAQERLKELYPWIGEL